MSSQGSGTSNVNGREGLPSTQSSKNVQSGEAFKQLSSLKYGRQKDFVGREILRRIRA